MVYVTPVFFNLVTNFLYFTLMIGKIWDAKKVVKLKNGVKSVLRLNLVNSIDNKSKKKIEKDCIVAVAASIINVVHKRWVHTVYICKICLYFEELYL